MLQNCTKKKKPASDKLIKNRNDTEINEHAISNTSGLNKNHNDDMKRSKLLRKNLDRDCVSMRCGFGNHQVLYIEGWQAIEIANSIFGYNGWSSKIYEMKEEYREVNNERGSKIFSLAYTCMCRVTLNDGVYHEDIGFGNADGIRQLGKAIEKAKKGAATDALKRALRQFGNALGNCCYSKAFMKTITKTKNEKISETKRKDLSMDLCADQESSLIGAELFETEE